MAEYFKQKPYRPLNLCQKILFKALGKKVTHRYEGMITETYHLNGEQYVERFDKETVTD